MPIKGGQGVVGSSYTSFYGVGRASDAIQCQNLRGCDKRDIICHKYYIEER